MQNQEYKGFLYAFSAYILWGILPLYWKLIHHVSALEILSNRILWAFLFTAAIVMLLRQGEEVKRIIRDRNKMWAIVAASLLIAVNWGLYIWSVNSGKIVEASLGYYINPLISVLLGVFFFKEKLQKAHKIALLLAAAGVILKTIEFGEFPWISVALALTFGLYGAVKKSVNAGALVGLTLEAGLLAPIALVYIAIMQGSGNGAYVTADKFTIILLFGSGIITALPLLLFASGTKRLPLSMMGFIQYISPTISLLLGVFLYHEPFTGGDMTGFGLIWIALAIFTVAQVRRQMQK